MLNLESRVEVATGEHELPSGQLITGSCDHGMRSGPASSLCVPAVSAQIYHTQLASPCFSHVAWRGECITQTGLHRRPPACYTTTRQPPKLRPGPSDQKAASGKALACGSPGSRMANVGVKWWQVPGSQLRPYGRWWRLRNDSVMEEPGPNAQLRRPETLAEMASAAGAPDRNRLPASTWRLAAVMDGSRPSNHRHASTRWSCQRGNTSIMIDV